MRNQGADLVLPAAEYNKKKRNAFFGMFAGKSKKEEENKEEDKIQESQDQETSTPAKRERSHSTEVKKSTAFKLSKSKKRAEFNKIRS